MALAPRSEVDEAADAALPDGPAWPLVTRRDFLASASAAAAGLALGTATRARAEEPVLSQGAASVPGAVPVNLRVNGQRYALRLEARVTLLDALREVIGLPGTKKGCDRGQCGACTVLVDGRRINACLALAIMHQDADITTIEGLGNARALHPMQAAFLARDGFQCGYCTPGQICSAVAAVDEIRRGEVSAVTPDVRHGLVALQAAEIRERMSGNLCRCGAYPNIVAAVTDVLGQKG